MIKKRGNTDARKVDLGKLKLDRDDFSYDVSRILSNALVHAIGAEDASRIERFIETMSGKSLGELVYDDVKKVIEYLELALGTSTPRVVNELVKALMNYSNCDINVDYERIDGYEALELVIRDLIKCLKGRSKRIREIASNLLKEILLKRSKKDSK